MSTETRWTWSVEARFPSVRGGGQYLIAELLAALKRDKWSEGDIFGVHLAVEEALVNAICHGNRSDANKHVSMACKLTSDRVLIEIADEGKGFDPALRPRLHRGGKSQTPQRPWHYAHAKLHVPGRIHRRRPSRADGKTSLAAGLIPRLATPATLRNPWASGSIAPTGTK